MSTILILKLFFDKSMKYQIVKVCNEETLTTLVINWKSWSFSSSVHTASSASSSLFFSFPSTKCFASGIVNSPDFSSSFISFCSVFLSICPSIKSNCFSLFSSSLHLLFSLSFSFLVIVSRFFPFSSLHRGSFDCAIFPAFCALSVSQSWNQVTKVYWLKWLKPVSRLITMVGFWN